MTEVNQGFVSGFRYDHETVFHCSRWKTFHEAKVNITHQLADLERQDKSLHELNLALIDELEEIYETDLNVDHPIRLTNVRNLVFLVGDVKLMKEHNIWKFDQAIKIERDHLMCGIDIESGGFCKYDINNNGDEQLWHTHM